MNDTRDMRVPTAEELFERLKSNTANVSKHPWKDWGISKGEWVEYLQGRIRQDLAAPKDGHDAPDFTVERLGAEGKRTGEMVQLSSLFGKPVALLFGSYT
ncbi:MAG: hypothetical protein QF386_04510 [Alphaproteobacteria bacterium]|nr:hypothetical protein [Alphaproteobacteria bacterium]